MPEGSNYSFIIMIVLMVGGLYLMNRFAKNSQKKQQNQREEMLNNQMSAGAWVQTYSGFFGRYVDIDGDVVILETPSGEETYWLKGAIKLVGEPPFEVVEEDVEGSDSDAGIPEIADTVPEEIVAEVEGQTDTNLGDEKSND